MSTTLYVGSNSNLVFGLHPDFWDLNLDAHIISGSPTIEIENLSVETYSMDVIDYSGHVQSFMMMPSAVRIIYGSNTLYNFVKSLSYYQSNTSVYDLLRMKVTCGPGDQVEIRDRSTIMMAMPSGWSQHDTRPAPRQAYNSTSSGSYNSGSYSSSNYGYKSEPAKPKCDCGAAAINSKKHYDWCYMVKNKLV